MEESYRETISDIQQRYGTRPLESTILYHTSQVNHLFYQLPGGRTGPEIIAASQSHETIFRLIARRVAARHYPGWETKGITDEGIEAHRPEE